MVLHDNITYYTVKEAAQIMNVTPKCVTGLTRDGTITATTIGRFKLISADEIKNYFRRREGSGNDGLQQHDT